MGNNKIEITSDSSFSIGEAASLNTINEFTIIETDVDITLEDVFAPDKRNTHFKALNSFVSNSTNTTITVEDSSSGTGSTIDLSRITTLQNINTLTINGDSGANNIILPKPIFNVTNAIINLGEDTAADTLTFNLDPDNFSTDYESLTSYTKINNFNVHHDKLQILLNQVNLFSSSNYITTITSAEKVELTAPYHFIDTDHMRTLSNQTSAFDTVAEVKDLIVDIVTTSGGSKKAIFIFYIFNTETSQEDAILIAADVEDETNLEDRTFSVSPIAHITNISRGVFSVDNFI